MMVRHSAQSHFVESSSHIADNVVLGVGNIQDKFLGLELSLLLFFLSVLTLSQLGLNGESLRLLIVLCFNFFRLLLSRHRLVAIIHLG
jgi:hypothetical protein